MSAGDAVGNSSGEDVGMDLDGVSNLLVLAPTMSSAARRSYYEGLLPERPSTLDVLAVEYRRSPDQWLDEWQQYVGDRPRQCTIVSTDETTRSAAAASGGPVTYGPNTAACVENPSDLTGLGITVSEYLSEHGGSNTVVTFDSLTALLQYVELQRAFRFLHVLANRVKTAESVAHFHMDPAAHDDREVATLSSLFDAVAEFEDGEWSLRRR
ncbi:DUF835 domain-containing protein [Natronomonas sp. CBA1123]|uniref:DUF7504 family protein n=1 Tax=Natronomonas sp. CBA1123 TaxID=2668070 RepID=UPI0012E9B9EB|nr:DUF835 domain-containing protein [Natronomonas sp. CBA1123]MUV85509.1 DUF835 domain-containing protein [Natronomonas sp. CBA1123]